jgi:hypothetical protein
MKREVTKIKMKPEQEEKNVKRNAFLGLMDEFIHEGNVDWAAGIAEKGGCKEKDTQKLCYFEEKNCPVYERCKQLRDEGMKHEEASKKASWEFSHKFNMLKDLQEL